MLKRGFIAIFLLSFLAPLLTVDASASGVVINSFQISSENGANDEYVELYNSGDSDVDISGWKLTKKSASASATPIYLKYEVPAGILLSPGAKLKIAHPDCASSADIYYSNSAGNIPTGIASNNTITLLDKNKQVVDKVGFGTAADFEGTPIAKSPEVGEIYSRRNSGQDTDNNQADFYLSYSPPIETEPEKDSGEKDSDFDVFPEATAGAKLRVSEFMINPEGSDTEGEWIEIFNAGGDANISGYAIADRLGSPKKYSFPKGTTIKKGQYLAFYSGQTPISLNNDGDAVEIRTPEGSVISYSENSGKGPEGMSFAYDGSKWSWTKHPTPGRANIIEKPSDEEMSGKKSSKNEGEVLALVDESQLPGELESSEAVAAKKNDRLMGYGLIALAIIGGISYTLHINKEWIVEHLNKIRDRDHITGREIWSKIKRR